MIRCLTFALVLHILASPAIAASRQADDYFFIRDRGQLVAEVSPEDIRRSPETFQGKLIEVRGSVSAQIESAVVIRTATDLDMTIILPAGKAISDYPTVQVNFVVRLLCRVVTDPGGVGSAELVLHVRENEAAAVEAERERIRKAAEGRAKLAAPVRTATIEGADSSSDRVSSLRRYSSGEVVTKYSSALRYFFESWSDTEASQVAKMVIASANKGRTDGRLIMAMIAFEGPPDRLVFKKGQPLLHGKPLSNVLGEWSTLIRKGTRGKLPTEKNIRQALTSRGQFLSRIGRSRKLKPQEYATAIVRLYWQMLPEHEQSSWTPGESDLEDRWRDRGWTTRMPVRLRGTWSGLGGTMLAVVNGDGTGVFGTLGGDRGQWREAKGYLEFRSKGELGFRGKYRISDDGKALTLIRLDQDGTEGADVTFLKQ